MVQVTPPPYNIKHNEHILNTVFHQRVSVFVSISIVRSTFSQMSMFLVYVTIYRV